MNDAIEAAIEIINAGIRNIKNMHENYPTKGAMAGAFTVIKIVLRQNAGAVDVEALDIDDLWQELHKTEMRSNVPTHDQIRAVIRTLSRRGLIKSHEGGCRGDPNRNGCDHCEPEHGCKPALSQPDRGALDEAIEWLDRKIIFCKDADGFEYRYSVSVKRAKNS